MMDGKKGPTGTVHSREALGKKDNNRTMMIQKESEKRVDYLKLIILRLQDLLELFN